MRNLYVILGILGIIFLVVLFLFIGQIKNTDFGGIGEWFSKVSTNLTPTENTNEDINVDEEDTEDFDETYDEEEAEDVGDLNYYTVEIGRSDADILSKRTYTFYLPVDIEYELMGVDASSSIFEFRKDGKVIFKMDNFDYTKPEDQIDEFWPKADDYSLVGGHTNILQLEDDDYEDEMYIFADTLQLDGKAAF